MSKKGEKGRDEKERRKEILFSWSFHGGRVNSEISLLRVSNRRKKRDIASGEERERDARILRKTRWRDWSGRATKLSSTKASSSIIRSPERVVDSGDAPARNSWR